MFFGLLLSAVNGTTHGMSTSDVSVQLFRDSRCFERAGSVVWDTEGSCFVNTYDLVQSKAFTVSIIDSMPKGGEVIRISLWSDDCQTALSAGATTITATAGICSPVLGSLYGIYTVKYRNSLTSCEASDCSTASTLKITRYWGENCEGLASSTKWKSADGLCVKEGTDVEKYSVDAMTLAMSYSLWRNSNNCTSDVSPDQTATSVVTEGCMKSVGISFYYSVLSSKAVASLAGTAGIAVGLLALVLMI
jgi:hypothetical protein